MSEKWNSPISQVIALRPKLNSRSSAESLMMRLRMFELSQDERMFLK